MTGLLEHFMGIVGWILHYVSNTGKIYFHSSNCRMFCMESDGAGSFCEKVLSKDSDGGEMEFELLIYNNSNNNRIIRDINILLKSKIINSFLKIRDDDSRKISSQREVFDDLIFLNIPPNSVIKKHLRISLGKDEVREIFNKEVQVNLFGKKLYGILRFKNLNKKILSISKGNIKYI